MSAAAIRRITAELQSVASYDGILSPAVLQSAMLRAADKLATVPTIHPEVRRLSQILCQVANSDADIVACRRSSRTLAVGLLRIAEIIEEGEGEAPAAPPRPVFRMSWLQRLRPRFFAARTQ